MDGLTVTKFVMDNTDNNLLQTREKPLFRDEIKKNNIGFVEGQIEFQRVF